jgi:hypothetical protein
VEKLLSAFELYFCKREKDLLFIFFEPRDRFDITFLRFDSSSSSSSGNSSSSIRSCAALSSSFFPLSSFLCRVCVRERFDTTYDVVLCI